MYEMDMSEEKNKEILPEGWYDLEIVKVEALTSRQGNPMFKISFALADNPTKGIEMFQTNMQGKRFMLWKLLEACEIEPIVDENGKEKYHWQESDIEGHTVSAKIIHDKKPFIGRDGQERIIPKAKIAQFRKMSILKNEEA